MIKKRRFTLSTTHMILLSFAVVILLGSLLLSLPVSAANGEATPFLDALFTATTSTCVTGLVVVPTVSAWSPFGQAVILVLIQVGGLGVITLMAGVMILLNRKMGLSDRLLLQDAFNLNSLAGLVRFVKKVVIGTFAVEAVGALLYMTVFVPDFGLRGVWISVFTAVSAFCNAGIDILSEASLCDYALNPTVNGVTMALIVLGGLGYVVWWDLVRVARQKRSKKIKFFRSLTLHSKIVLSATLALIVLGTLLVLIFEWNNPLTIGSLSLGEKIEVSLFQSVTTRTAGFATVPQEDLTGASSLICLLLMFIGGSPVGTAGGIKTVTLVVLAAAAVSAIRGKEDTDLFGRQITKQAVRRALSVTVMSFFIFFASSVLLSAVSAADTLDVLYETASATATVGLTRALTPSLGTAGRWILIFTMYLGRVGPISLALAFNRKHHDPNCIHNPTEEVSVG